MTALSGSDGGQRYAPGYEPGITDLFRFRNAERFSRHLLVHLRPGMRVLDGGCGPGTITMGLASRVVPGDVLGIDRDVKQVAAATTTAQQAGVLNLRFEAGDILHLPCPDASVDVVHLSCVLTHLPTPLDALKEAWRVLKPGGIVSVRDPVFASTVWCPENALVIEACQLIIRAIQHAGGNANRGKHLGYYSMRPVMAICISLPHTMARRSRRKVLVFVPCWQASLLRLTWRTCSSSKDGLTKATLSKLSGPSMRRGPIHMALLPFLTSRRWDGRSKNAPERQRRSK